MFIVTARIPKRRLISAGIGLLCCCVAVIAGLIFSIQRPAVTASAEVNGRHVGIDQVAYLESLGWQVNAEPLAVETLLVPEEFDETYDEYLALQSGQGFDLTPYCGKKISRCTYEITNYPTGEEGVQISLLVFKDTVIGGEVISPTVNGFLHGLAMPKGLS